MDDKGMERLLRQFAEKSGSRIKILDEDTAGTRGTEFLESMESRMGEGYTKCVKAGAEILSFVDLLKSANAPPQIVLLATMLAAKYIAMAVSGFYPQIKDEEKQQIVDDAMAFLKLASDDVEDKMKNYKP